jgi:hypothetical protein
VISAWLISIRGATSVRRRLLPLGTSLIKVASDRLRSLGFVKQPIALASLPKMVASCNPV